MTVTKKGHVAKEKNWIDRSGGNQLRKNVRWILITPYISVSQSVGRGRINITWRGIKYLHYISFVSPILKCVYEKKIKIKMCFAILF